MSDKNLPDYSTGTVRGGEYIPPVWGYPGGVSNSSRISEVVSDMFSSADAVYAIEQRSAMIKALTACLGNICITLNTDFKMCSFSDIESLVKLLKDSKDAKDKELHKVQEELKVFKRDIDDRPATRALVDGLRMRVKELEAANEKLQANNAKLQADNTAVCDASVKNARERDNNLQLYREAKEREVALQDQMDALQEAHDKLVQKYHTLKSDHSKLKIDHGKLQHLAAKAMTSVMKMDRRIDKMEKMMERVVLQP